MQCVGVVYSVEGVAALGRMGYCPTLFYYTLTPDWGIGLFNLMKCTLFFLLVIISGICFGQTTVLNGKSRAEVIERMKLEGNSYVDEKYTTGTDSLGNLYVSSKIIYKAKDAPLWFEYAIENEECFATSIIISKEKKYILIKAITEKLGVDWFLGDSGETIWITEKYIVRGQEEGAFYKVIFFL